MTHTLRLKCYNCGAIMRSFERQAGKRSRCAACKAPLRIPAATVFAQYDGQKVQAPKETEWDFKYLKDQQPKDPARTGFIGEVTADDDEDELFVASGRGDHSDDDSEIGESEPAGDGALDDSAVDAADLADVFAAAGEEAAEDMHDTATDEPWHDFGQTLSDEPGEIARSNVQVEVDPGFDADLASNIATPSLMDLTDDASVAAAAAAESVVGAASLVAPPEEATDADGDDEDDDADDDDEASWLDSDPAAGDEDFSDTAASLDSNIATPSLMDLTGDASVAAAAAGESTRGFAESDIVFGDDLPDSAPSRPMSEVDDDFRTEEFTRTVDDSGGSIASTRLGGPDGDDDVMFESLEDEQAPAAGALPEIAADPPIEGSVVEFGDSDLDIELPGAVTGNEADLKALLDDFDDELDG